MMLYLLVIVCTHGPDRKQLLVESVPFTQMETCRSAETTVKKQMGEACAQLGTDCLARDLRK